MKKFVAMVLVIVSVFALAAPAMALGVPWCSVKLYQDGPTGPIIYTAMSTSSTVLKNLNTSTQKYLQIKWNTDKLTWVKTEWNGKTGYIQTKFLDPTHEPFRVALLGADAELIRSEMTGQIVDNLQLCLKKLGYFTKDSINGKFGPHTLTAVKAFQRAKGLDDDGIVGRATKVALVNACF